jgi:alcohol dehydrogenase class IV
MTDVLALGAIRSIIHWLPEATRNGSNRDARQAMSEAAAMAGMAFDQSGLALAHAIGGPLTATYHLHHGLGIAVLLPATLSFNAPEISDSRIMELKKALDLPESPNPEDLATWARKFIGNLGLPTRLSEVGLQKQDIPQIAEGSTHMAMFGNNIRTASEKDLVTLLEANL